MDLVNLSGVLLRLNQYLSLANLTLYKEVIEFEWLFVGFFFSFKTWNKYYKFNEYVDFNAVGKADTIPF